MLCNICKKQEYKGYYRKNILEGYNTVIKDHQLICKLMRYQATHVLRLGGNIVQYQIGVIIPVPVKSHIKINTIFKFCLEYKILIKSSSLNLSYIVINSKINISTIRIQNNFIEEPLQCRRNEILFKFKYNNLELMFYKLILTILNCI